MYLWFWYVNIFIYFWIFIHQKIRFDRQHRPTRNNNHNRMSKWCSCQFVVISVSSHPTGIKPLVILKWRHFPVPCLFPWHLAFKEGVIWWIWSFYKVNGFFSQFQATDSLFLLSYDSACTCTPLNTPVIPAWSAVCIEQLTWNKLIFNVTKKIHENITTCSQLMFVTNN